MRLFFLDLFLLMLTTIHIIGIILTIGLILGVSIVSARSVKDAQSFTTGGKAGAWMVSGAIMGSLVGGQSTIGTAQLAFSFGLSAWWFTIGAALGALALGLAYAGPLRRSGCTTLTEIITHEYGRKAGIIGTLLCLLGIFISIVAQVLSSSAMMISLFEMSHIWAAVISALLIMLFVLFGGIKSAGAGGIIKMLMLYVSSIVAGVVVWKIANGWGDLMRSIEGVYENSVLASENGLLGADEVRGRYSNLVARGVMKDLGGCLSLVLGVVSTQTYAQGIWSASSTEKSRRGALICVFLTPFIGAACTLVGMYMRGHYVTVDELSAIEAAGGVLPEGMGVLQNSAQAFPAFVLGHLPAWLGGIVIGTLLVTILGGGSGLSLGAATILVRDVFGNLGLKRKGQGIYQLTIVGLLIVAVIVALSTKRAFINDLGFLSLGLRATAILFPLSFALWMPGKIDAKFARWSMVLGTVAMLMAKFMELPADPVYWGLGVGLMVILMGRRGGGK